MRRFTLLMTLAVLGLAPAVSGATVVSNGTSTATIDETGVVLCNQTVCRTWEPDRLVTTSIERAGALAAGTHADLTLDLDGARVTSDLLPVNVVTAEAFDGGARITWRLEAAVAEIVRTVTVFDGIAAFEARTTIEPRAPAALSGYSLDEVAIPDGTATIHAFRAGADWRFDDGWAPFSIGDPHQGDWRVSTSGTDLTGNAEWLSVAEGPGARIAMVMERRDYASSVMSYTGGVAAARVDFSRDIVYFGPIEESAHAENPTPAPARHRALVPGRALALEPVLTVVPSDIDDEPWQYYRYLTEHRLNPYRKDVTFNTNRVDSNAISTGAKDDVDFERFLSLAEAAREMGVDTFILDDGWQARSGDWCPDSPQCPEPRWDGTPDSKFAPRFPDDRFEAVRAVLDGDPDDPTDDIDLGLWWTPMEFHPSSDAFATNPQWACAPVGHGTAGLSIADPNSSSNEAGLGVWNPLALGVHPDTGEPLRLSRYIEDRIRRAIDEYGARYFKFDFLVWIDCAGIEPADMYAYHDEFVAMVDRLQATYPEVTFQIDETNDYRLFPFESIARGPSWFQNGAPPSEQLLHNLWNLAPYVPGWSLGQHALGSGSDKALKGIDTLMAAALPSHITFWNEPDTELTSEERAQVKRWTDFYRAHPDIAGFSYPLLADPAEGDWTALQQWDVDAARGWVLVYRQASPQSARPIPLRGLGRLVADTMFTATLHDPADGSSLALGTFDAETLRTEGMPVSIADEHGYAIVRLEPADQ